MIEFGFKLRKYLTVMLTARPESALCPPLIYFIYSKQFIYLNHNQSNHSIHNKGILINNSIYHRIATEFGRRWTHKAGHLHPPFKPKCSFAHYYICSIYRLSIPIHVCVHVHIAYDSCERVYIYIDVLHLPKS